MIVKCQGVSIVWSALCGYNPLTYYKLLDIYDYSKSTQSFISITLAISCLYSVILWVYYAVVEEALTTIAHLCALILGIAIAYILNPLWKEADINKQHDPSRPLLSSIPRHNSDQHIPTETAIK